MPVYSYYIHKIEIDKLNLLYKTPSTHDKTNKCCILDIDSCHQNKISICIKTFKIKHKIYSKSNNIDIYKNSKYTQ